MDEREDLYADDHTLGGRGVSRENPGQNGLPVVPMTVSLEAMCEAALLLAPGKVVVSIRNVRLYRWLPFDPEPTTLEVRANQQRQFRCRLQLIGEHGGGICLALDDS